jgi:hypothetical protein
MKKELIVLMFAFLLLINIVNVNAMIEYWQQKSDMGNGTIKNHLVVFYSKTPMQFSTTPKNTLLCNLFKIFCVSETGIIEDYVSGNNPYEVYLWYNIYVQKWNIANPNYKVNRCDWNIRFWGHLENSTTTFINQSYTQADNDVMNAKYFMRLSDGDGMIATQICYFQNQNYHELDIPAEMQLVTPSWECKACQFYEWSLLERDIEKAKSIGDNVVTISDYIKKLILLNFEILLALFWIFLILMIFVAIGLIFVGIYWLFLYLKNITR